MLYKRKYINFILSLRVFKDGKKFFSILLKNIGRCVEHLLHFNLHKGVNRVSLLWRVAVLTSFFQVWNTGYLAHRNFLEVSDWEF